MRGRIPSRQATGLYVHSSPPTGVPVHDSVVRQWLRGGEITRLRELVLEGDGPSLVGEYSPDVTARAFLRALPRVLSRIDEAHKAAAEGDIDRLEKALKRERSLRVELSKDHAGLSLLHKAVIHGHHGLQEWLVKNYPETVHLTDRERRSALHYAGSSPDSEEVWKRLTEAGADPTATDSAGNTPAYYMHHPRKARPPQPRGSQIRQDKAGLIVKPANIRIWIHDRDLGRLQKVVWEGYGHKLLSETSTQPKVRRFLNAVPYILGSIRDVHKAAIENDVETLTKKSEDPVPKNILLSKDANGLNPLHKAAGLGQKDAVNEILSRAPEAANAQDNLGRTPLHYAAGLRDPELYQILVEAGATDHLQDKKGNTPSYYRSKPGELEGGRLLYLVPEAPRTAHIFPPSWDWRLLQTPARPQDSSERITQESTAEEMTQEDVSKDEGVDESRPEVSEDEGVGSENAQSVDDTASPQASEKLDMEQEDDPEDRLGRTVTLSSSEMFGDDSGLADAEAENSSKTDSNLLEPENNNQSVETIESGNNNNNAQEENSQREEGGTNNDNNELEATMKTVVDLPSDEKQAGDIKNKNDAPETGDLEPHVKNQEPSVVENKEENVLEPNETIGEENQESNNDTIIEKEQEKDDIDTEENRNEDITEHEIITQAEKEESKHLNAEETIKLDEIENKETATGDTHDNVQNESTVITGTLDEPQVNDDKADPIEDSHESNINNEKHVDETNTSGEIDNDQANTADVSREEESSAPTEKTEETDVSDIVNEGNKLSNESENIVSSNNEIDRETGEASNIVEHPTNSEEQSSNLEEEKEKVSVENETGESKSLNKKVQSGRQSLKSRVQNAIRLGRGQTEDEGEKDIQAQGSQGTNVEDEDTKRKESTSVPKKEEIKSLENSNDKTDVEVEEKKESQEEFPDSLEGTPQKRPKTGENKHAEPVSGGVKENEEAQIVEIHKSRQSSAETRTLSASGKG